MRWVAGAPLHCCMQARRKGLGLLLRALLFWDSQGSWE
jgi:hypothetical protein